MLKQLRTRHFHALTLTICFTLATSSTPAQAETHSEPTPLAPDLLVAELDMTEGTVPITPGTESPDGVNVPKNSNDDVLIDLGENGDIEFALPVDDAPADVTPAGAAVYDDDANGVEYIVQTLDASHLPDVRSITRTLITIEDEDSATVFDFPLSLPDGADAALQDDGSVVVTAPDGTEVAKTGAPWALDHEGAHLPTWFELDKGVLRQHVDTTGATFPVVADPVWLVPVLATGGRMVGSYLVRANTKQAAHSLAKGKITASPTGFKLGGISRLQFRSFTQRNARHNLIVRTARDPKRCQAHHVYPSEFKRHSIRWGLKESQRNHPSNLRWWNSTAGRANNHQSLAWKYNREWGAWWDHHLLLARKRGVPRNSLRLVLRQGHVMDMRYRPYYNG